MLEIDIYSDILSIPAHFVDEKIEKLEAKFKDKIKINYRWISLLADTDAPNSRAQLTDFYEHIEKLKDVSQYFHFNDGIWLNKIRTSSSGAHLFLKAVELSLKDKGEDSYQSVHALANRYRRIYFEDGEDISNFLVLEKALDQLNINKAEVNAYIRDSRALTALIEDENSCFKLHAHKILPLLSFQRGSYKLYGDVSYKVIENMVENLLHLTDRRAA
jgi:predicted DsbA family dithiol-disulfide isomerase